MYHDKLTMAQPISYQRLLGRNVREQRLKLGLRQDDVARQAQALGLHWTQATVAAIETGRRQTSLGEALLLALLFVAQLVLGGFLRTALHSTLGADQELLVFTVAYLVLSLIFAVRARKVIGSFWRRDRQKRAMAGRDIV